MMHEGTFSPIEAEHSSEMENKSMSMDIRKEETKQRIEQVWSEIRLMGRLCQETIIQGLRISLGSNGNAERLSLGWDQKDSDEIFGLQT